MTINTDAERLDLLEKRVAELTTLVRFQDAMRVQIEKTIGVIDQQLIKTDAGLHHLRDQLRRQMAIVARKPKNRPATRPKAKSKAKSKPKGKGRKRR